MTYNIFRDLAWNDAKKDDRSGLELLRQIFLQRSSEAENEQAASDLMEEFDRQMALNESKPMPVGH